MFQAPDQISFVKPKHTMDKISWKKDSANLHCAQNTILMTIVKTFDASKIAIIFIVFLPLSAGWVDGGGRSKTFYLCTLVAKLFTVSLKF